MQICKVTILVPLFVFRYLHSRSNHVDSLIMNKNKNYDLAGILFSALCGAHCIITPILILNSPSIGRKFESPWVQTILLCLIAAIFYQSVWRSFKSHRSKLTLGLGASGFLILISTYLAELFAGHEHHMEHAHHHDETFSIMMAIIGSVLMISSHLLNIRLCKCSEVKS